MARKKIKARRKNQRAKGNRKSNLIERRQRETARLEVQMLAIEQITTSWINAVWLSHAIEQHKRNMPKFRKSYAFEAWAESFV